ncbi:MAG: LytTR family DNA-binding domain-containing protein [Saprospiraceae bacterium]|jgi:two-component system LytT family response regulator|nr:response regulator transcription factor [Lewinellaceae bacterium]
MPRNLIIIDNNPSDIEHLKQQIAASSADWDVGATFNCAEEALEYIRRHPKPDLIFSDIHLPNMDGFELLRQLPRHFIPVVFVTTFEEHAIRAFSTAAIDFLLKPVTPERLVQTFEKIRFYNQDNFRQQFEVLQQTLQELLKDRPQVARIVVNSQQTVEVLDTREITHCEANGAYTSIYLSVGKTVTAAKPLRHFEALLDPQRFFRVHRSFLVNVHMIRQIRKETYQISLTNNALVPVASEHLGSLMARLRSITPG